ncbi:hypothetical protein ABID99_003489 [Mucilaginibacter sp. OAE612]|uniref:RagB/SusD family nutrient uptake outer membrane protein n=1 Tax=Mucilaginibacter sp. OAE612 TaxID=3156444 RepID=UPI00359F092E
MKKIFYILSSIIIISVITFTFSCTKLKDKDYATIVASDFKPGTEDLASLLGAGYTYWRPLELGRSANSVFRTNEISADELVIPERPNGWVDGGIYRRMHEHKWTSDEDNSYQIWNNAYAGITTCNRVIYQIENGLIPMTTGKEAALAELKVLRASFYYPLCDFFGGVPIITKFDLPSGFLPTQSTRQQVYDFIVSEVTTNLPQLSAANDQTTYGKFNQWAAHALLAKVYLNAGVYTGTPAWDKCITECNAIINSGVGFGLESNQSSVFATENELSKEIIFAIPFDEKFTPDNANAFALHMESLEPENQATYNFQYSPWGGICAIPQFINTFDPDDSRLKNNWIQGQQYTLAGLPINGSLGAYTGKPLNYINVVPGVDSTEEVHGFRLGKFEYKQGALLGLSNDFPLFRYADVLMMKAECLLRTGDANGAATLVTQVRQRDFTANPSKAIVTGAQLQAGSVYDYGLRNHIKTTTEGGADIQYGRFLDELGWEFNTEGRRRQDLIRFGVFTKKSWLSHAPNGDYRVLLPLPRQEVVKNPNLKQNTGY